MNEKEPTQMTTEEKIKNYEERIEHSKLEIKALKEEIYGLKQYKEWRKECDQMKALHNCMMDSGFTNEQAFELIKIALGNAIGANMYRR